MSAPPSVDQQPAPEGDRHYLKDELYELVRSDERIIEFIDAGSLDGLWFWDIDRPDQEWMSPRFKEVFGYAEDEIPNTSAWWQENIHPDDLQIALTNFQRHLDDPDHPYDQVVRYRHRDGSTVWVRCRGVAIRDPDGTPRRLLGAHTEITDLMQARTELRRSRQRWEATLDHAPIGLALVDPNGRFLEVNESLAGMLGFTRAQLKRITFQQITHPDDLDRDMALVRDCLAGVRDSYTLEKRYLTAEGSILEIELSASLVRDDLGNPEYFIAQILDISDRVRDQRELERSNAELREFAFVASHDLKAPQRQIASMLELLERKLDASLAESERRLLRSAMEASGRAQKLIDDLLAVARIGSNEQEPGPVDVHAVIAEVREEFEADIASSGGSVSVSGEPAQVVIHRPHLRTVFMNLIENSLKYAAPGRSPEINIEIARHTGEVGIRVTDNGRGMDPRHSVRAFEMFKRLDRSPGVEGSGIGLALAARAIERSLGSIRIDADATEPGRGTTIEIRLPVATGTPAR